MRLLCTLKGHGRVTRRHRRAWNSIATAALLPFHRCRSETGADRALANAWSSSGAGASSATSETPARQRSSSDSARVAPWPLLRFVQVDYEQLCVAATRPPLPSMSSTLLVSTWAENVWRLSLSS